jgi:hypothetical protein
MMLSEFVAQIPDFSKQRHAEKIKIFGWFIHAKEEKAVFRVADIRRCYDELHLDAPANVASSVQALAEKRPPELLATGSEYRLHANVRSQLDAKFSSSVTTIVVEKALAGLPGRIANESERLFLEETLICYRHRAFRATIVMAWNLAYDHLARWIMADAARLATFNAGIAKRNAKKAYVTIAARDDFEELKEDETVDIAAALTGITSGMKRILKEKLGRRNSYAHPSTLEIGQSAVDDMIVDLVTNVVLKLQ